MQKNMGKIDRIIRILFAVVVGILYFSDSISGLTVVILGIFAVVFLATSFIGFCPLYRIFNISTGTVRSKENEGA